MEERNDKDSQYNYNSILQKINHKPLLVATIFSYIKDEPFKFLHIIEKDQVLKESINSQFFNVKKNNLFSKEINDNIGLLLFYKKYKEIFRQTKNKDNIIFQKYDIEANIINNIKNISDPSFILYKANYFANQVKLDMSLPIPSIEGLYDIALNQQEKYEHIQLVLLPDKCSKFKDYLYIQKNLRNKNNNGMNKEIDTLYCIIDDNEYFFDKILNINESIIINEIYFIYIKGDKDINIINAIHNYLKVLNKKNIKSITFGSSFYEFEFSKENSYHMRDKDDLKNSENTPIMEMIKDSVINKQRCTFPKSISLRIFDNLKRISTRTNLKIYLGFNLLFSGQNIENIYEVNSNSYNPGILEKIKNSKIINLIIKFNGLSSLDDNNYHHFVQRCLKLDIPNIIFYIDIDKSNNKKENDKVINFKLDEFTNYLLYSEIPTKKLNLSNHFDCYQVIDSNNNIIIEERVNNNIYNYLICHLFLLKKYNNLCFSYYHDENVYYKMYFIQKKDCYDIYVVNKDENKYQKEEDLKIYQYWDKKNFDNIVVYFEEVIEYCKEFLNLKIDKVTYNNIPLDWNDILKNKLNNKNKNFKAGLSKKLFSNKINQKQIFEYELEDEEYFDDDEEENDDFQDDNA